MLQVVDSSIACDLPTFEQVCTPLYFEVINHARRRWSGDLDRAKDVAQETMIRAWRAWDRFQPPPNLPLDESVRSWLYHIADNVFRNHYETMKRRKELSIVHMTEDGCEFDWNISGPDPRAIVDEHEEREPILAAIATLHPDHRGVIECYYFLGLDLLDISRLTGIPRRTVKSRLHRARAMIRKHLAREDARESSRTRQYARKAPGRKKRDTSRVDRVVRSDDAATLACG